MPASTALFQFAAEFVTFLAGAAGVALVLVRAPLMGRAAWGKAALGVGFAGLGTAAFLHGSQVLRDGDDPLVLGLRAAGVVLVAFGTASWAGSRPARRLMWLGLALTALSIPLARGGQDNASAVVLALGGLGLGTGLLAASRRSIAARVAASSAGTLLLVVLVLSVALSTVLSSAIRDEQLRRLDGQALTEVSQIQSAGDDVIGNIRVATATLANERSVELQDLFARPRVSEGITADLRLISDRYLSGLPLGYVTPLGNAIASYRLELPTLLALAGSRVVEEAASGQEATSVQVVGRSLLSVSASQVFAPPAPAPGGRPVGVVIGVVGFDASYLERRAANEVNDADLALALVDRTQVLATFRQQPGSDTMLRLASQVLESGRATSAVSGNRFVVVRPVLTSDRRPIATLVASKPLTIIDQNREDLFRTLFLIALGGTLIALVLAAFVGDRIGSGVRRLTEAAEVIQKGELGVRSGVSSDDEVGVLGAAFDSMVASIEEKTEAESQLRGRLEAVVAGMGEALVAVDDDGRITDFNRAAEEVVGITASLARGSVVDDIIEFVGDDGVHRPDVLRSPTPGRSSLTGWVERADGGRVPVSLTAGTLRSQAGDRTGSVFVLRDLRREREIERMKTEFLSRVGHELRTPLTVIRGYADMLSRSRMAPAQAASAYDEILEQSRRLQRIVEMLEFNAASAAGRVYLRPERFDLRTVAAQAVERRANELPPKVKLTKRVARGLPKVMADKRWLSLAVDELVDNAIKFSPNGGKITLAADVSEDGDHIEVSVTDQGQGMSAAEREQAFGDFVQGDPSDTRRFGGLGLGLALVRDVAEAHGGRVECLSEPGKGSKFSVLLPMVPIEPRR